MIFLVNEKIRVRALIIIFLPFLGSLVLYLSGVGMGISGSTASIEINLFHVTGLVGSDHVGFEITPIGIHCIPKPDLVI